MTVGVSPPLDCPPPNQIRYTTMNITPEEAIQEFQRQFPKEFTICVQAIQIAKLQEQNKETPTEEDR